MLGCDGAKIGEEGRGYVVPELAAKGLSKIKPNYDPPSQQRSYEARPTWANSAAEAKTENLFSDCLLDAVLADPTRAIGFDADDPGLCKLDTSITTTLKAVTQSIRQYCVLTKNRFELLAAVENLEESKSSQEQEEATVVLPPRVAADTPEADATRSVLTDLSQNSINNVTTIEEVKASQEVRRQSRKPCRDFENANWRMRTQELRIIYATLAVRQRHKVKHNVFAKSRDVTALDHQIEVSIKSNNVEPDLSKTVVLEDIPDVAAKPEDTNPGIIRNARDQSKDANSETVRCVTDQPKIIEDPTSKEKLNASIKGKCIAIETIEDTGATR
ncbi:hypothetical protein BGZ47_010511, partial [Haplosporangium gracile]